MTAFRLRLRQWESEPRRTGPFAEGSGVDEGLLATK